LTTISKNPLICKTKKRIQEQKKKSGTTGLYRVPDHFLLVKDLGTCYEFTWRLVPHSLLPRPFFVNVS
jgi:hypothetical protein